MPQNELTMLYNIKSTEGKFAQKYIETIKKKEKSYLYTQSTTKRKQQRSTDKDTTSKLKHSKTTYNYTEKKRK